MKVDRAFYFRQRRKALGFTAVELGRLLDVGADTISRWERAAVPIPRAPFALVALMVDPVLGPGVERLLEREAQVGDELARVRSERE